MKTSKLTEKIMSPFAREETDLQVERKYDSKKRKRWNGYRNDNTEQCQVAKTVM